MPDTPGDFDYEAALAACAAGDRQAMHRLYEQEGARLLGVALRIVRQRALAEDIVHDACVNIWTRAASYDPRRGSARGWIYSVVRNLALNAVRDAGRHVDVDDTTTQALEADMSVQAHHEVEEAFALSASLGRIHYFDPPRVTVPGAPPLSDDGSAWVAEASLALGQRWSLGLAQQWDPDRERTNLSAVRSQWRFGNGGLAGIAPQRDGQPRLTCRQPIPDLRLIHRHQQPCWTHRLGQLHDRDIQRHLKRLPHPNRTAILPVKVLRRISAEPCRAVLHHGFRRILFLNGHGGNVATIQAAFAETYAPYSLRGEAAPLRAQALRPTAHAPSPRAARAHRCARPTPVRP